MSNVDLYAFLSSVAEQAGANLTEQHNELAPLGHWENFDMDLAMAVLEGEANGTSAAIPEPVLTTDATQLPLPGHACQIPVPTRCKQEPWQPIVYDSPQDQESVPSPPICSHTPHMLEITPHYSPSSHVQEHSPTYTQLDSFRYTPDYVGQAQPSSPDLSQYEHTQLSPHYSEYDQSQSSPEYSPCEENKEGVRLSDDRRLRRREQNRMAARRCRERKKMARSNLVKEYYELVSANAELTSRIERLEVERQRLNKTLHTHVIHCGLQTNTATCSSQ